MRVLLLLKYIPSPSTDLKGDLLWSTIEALVDAGVDVCLATDGRVGSERLKYIKIPYSVPFKILDKILNKFARLINTSSIECLFLRYLSYKSIKRNHFDNPFDIVLAECTTYSSALIAYELHLRLKIPYIVREHQNYESKPDLFKLLPSRYIKSLKTARHLVAVSDGQARVMRKIGIRSRVEVIPNSLSKSFFATPSTTIEDYNRTRLNDFKSSGVVFGAWTRWRQIKRLDLLLKAFSSAYELNDRIRLIVAGPIEIELKEITRGPQWELISNAVHFWGVASREDIHHLAFAVDCVVVPSDFETFALPVIEAMAGGKPSIVTRCNGPETLIPDARFGYVVDRGRADQLSKAIFYISNHIPDFDSNLIRSRAIDLYHTDTIGKHYVNLLSSAIHPL